MIHNSRFFIPALILALGIALGGLLMGQGIASMKSADRYVTVRGLNERDVKADLGVWRINFRAAGDDLATTQAELERQRGVIATFLAEANIQENEMQLVGQRVTDRLAQEYNNNQGGFRYLLQATMQVRTQNVEVLAKAGAGVSVLIKNGVTMADDGCVMGPIYSFTGLNGIKPEMLAEATANARAAAQQFAGDSGSEVGAIRRATQGYFSISARDQGSEVSEGGGGCEPSSIDKKVRVVTTVDYLLK
jgi:uncharacterized protein